jgi:hypothetical protein
VKLVAARELPANHLLQPGDLSLYTDGTQYVTRQFGVGKLVDPGEIWSAPDVTANKGMVPFSVTVAREQTVSRVVDAGEKLFVCPPKVQAEVRAVFCGDGAGACIAIVDVAEGDAEKLKDATELSLLKDCG